MWQAARPGRHLFVACSVAKCPYSGEKRKTIGLGVFHIWHPNGGGGGGSPRSRQKEQKQLICDSDKGGGSKKDPKILLTSYMEASYATSDVLTTQYYLFLRYCPLTSGHPGCLHGLWNEMMKWRGWWEERERNQNATSLHSLSFHLWPSSDSILIFLKVCGAFVLGRFWAANL